MKNKVIIIAILILISIILTAGMTTGMYKKTLPEKVDFYFEMEPEVIITTNKEIYDVGENVEITYTNIGNTIAGFVIGTSRPTIPYIIQENTENILFLSDPNDSYTCMMLYNVLLPDESFTMSWDQQYFGYYGDTFSPSEEVPCGDYYIELGYWEVTGLYHVPTHVPGGPPDHFSTSNIFTIV